MSKANFSKVESALLQGLQKMSIEELHRMVDLAASDQDRKKIEEALKQKKRHRQLIALSQELKSLAASRPDIFKKIALSKKQLSDWLKDPENLSEETWQKIAILKKHVRKEKEAVLVEEGDEKLVEKERKRHINKRFNINEKWLPLQ